MEHSREKAVGAHRQWAFRLWVGLTVLLSVYLLIAIPLADFFVDRYRFVVAGVPVVMFLLVVVGFGWLIWLVTARRRRGTRLPPAQGPAQDGAQDGAQGVEVKAAKPAATPRSYTHAKQESQSKRYEQ